MRYRLLLLAPLLAMLWLACQHSAPKKNAGTAIDASLWASDKDPVCGMKVDPTVEDTMFYQGKVYGFCNAACKEEFKSDPASYVGE